MVEIELTKEIIDKYKQGERVFIYNDDNIELNITIDPKKCFSRRDGTKKIGCYVLSKQDKDEINSGKSHLFYDGKTKVHFKLNSKEAL